MSLKPEVLTMMHPERNGTPEPGPLTLTEDEQELLAAYNDQQQAIAAMKQMEFQQIVAPIQAKQAERLRKIEQRLGLPAGAIGRDYMLSPDGTTLVSQVAPSATS